MDDGSKPLLTAILITPDTFAHINGTLRALELQTIREQIEVVLVVPSAAGQHLDERRKRLFAGFKILEVGHIRYAGEAIARAVYAAGADIVAYAEEHAFPEPEWAQYLVEAHKGPWAAVGAAVLNANPKTNTSWAHILSCFATILHAPQSMETSSLGWHQISYKRSLLLNYDDLGRWLETEGLLLTDLAKSGHRLYLEARAVTRHLNVSVFSLALKSARTGGRLWGAERAAYEKCNFAKRLLYAATTPLACAARVKRVIFDWIASGKGRRELYRGLPELLLQTMFHGYGEVLGYLFGAGNSRMSRCCMELRRYEYLVPEERREYERLMVADNKVGVLL
jgi:hypothetical protein